MSSDSEPQYMETIAGIAAPLTGVGVLLFALMPLALPILILTIVATVPLLVGGLIIGLVIGVVAAPIVIVRRLLRHEGDQKQARRSPEPPRLHVPHTPRAH